ncbi:cutinase family protein (plasmid) [Rhodococcus pseudokoreensis]|uniref:Cutinase family protein n=1 Tax=Rhodococcus pseudokoreensis TaxID=2811421 RepID=A0A974VZU5_9NOCA|nr:cutinase family protein [Rhodococcus pseudokoreensis]QSE88055.1 cutinase family protein [Rhodococcus pseudokoreensis]
MPARCSRARSVVALVACATVAGGAVALTAPAIAHADPTGCAATFNLLIPGTWETSENADPHQPVGILTPVADAITTAHGGRAEVYTLPYMARAFDNGHTYADSKVDALTKAEAVLTEVSSKCRNTKFTITGYSQGADAAGDLASGIGNDKGPVPADRVLAVGLLADPGAGTKGAAIVGPRTSGAGIADPRPQGMGTLSGRVASICDPGDLYCSIRKGDNPLLGSLGSILSKTTGTGDTSNVGGSAELATALTSDFSGADLPALGRGVAALGQQLAEPNINVGAVAATASSIAQTLAPMADLIDSGTAHAAAGQLAGAPVGSPEHSASEVLSHAGESDLSAALTAVTTLADTAGRLADSGSSVAGTSGDAAQLSAAATTLDGQLAPLTSTPADALSTASNVLSVLKPATVVGQVLNVATGVTALDVPGILRNLTMLPQKVAALDARGAHQVAGELNNQFAPLVKMAAAVDLRWVSQVLSVIPDPTGYTQIAALVASILANVDVIRLATLIGQIQEIAWTAVEKLLPPPGQLPDPLGAGAAMTGLLPVGLDLASVAVAMLSGKASKTPPELLGTTSKAATTIAAQAQNFDLPALTGSLTTMAQSRGAEDLAALVGEGLEAASFFTSGAHTNYSALVVDNAGRDAITWLSDWLTLQIGRSV